ncbi:hypothetical protein [Nocardia sp. NPDC059239]|uniref:hypothetical protein n=1 Tax=unclassified Nocardia TaxID=2637762 RepID=UPI00368F552E
MSTYANSCWQPGYAAIHIGLIHGGRACVDKEPGARNRVAQQTVPLYNRGGIGADQQCCVGTQGVRCCPGVKTIATYGGYSGRAPTPKILVKAAANEAADLTHRAPRRYTNQLSRSSRMPSTFVADVREADAYRATPFSARCAANWSRRR